MLIHDEHAGVEVGCIRRKSDQLLVVVVDAVVTDGKGLAVQVKIVKFVK